MFRIQSYNHITQPHIHHKTAVYLSDEGALR